MKKILLTLFTFLIVFQVSAQVIGKTYHVSSTSLNVRSEANLNSQLVQTLNKYDNVIIIDSTEINWYKVKTNTIEGYVLKKYLKKGQVIVSYYTHRTGAICRDGTTSSATGRGACSHHRGVAQWITSTQKSIRVIDE